MEFIFNLDPLEVSEPSYSLESSKTKRKGQTAGRRSLPASMRMGRGSMLALWGAVGVVMAVVISGWWFFLPLTYGKPGLSVEEVLRRKWLSYDLHFAK